mmetsp:Transcript_19362/g.48721  ORF Transcript_19362/g.48721 Transcript_19362/m.48721 type:complete len:185 (+) Transcript_19362:19-573(+)
MALRLSLVALAVSTAHGFVVTAGPRRSASMSRPRHDIVAAADYDKTVEGEYPHPSDSDYKFGDITKRMIRDMTGNKEYEFGDGSKALAEGSKEAAEKAAVAVLDAGGTAIEAGAAAKKVLDDSGYQFGDITKGAIKGFEGVVQEATGNEDYKFGDLTKNLAKNLFGGLEKGAAAAKKALENDDK